MPNLTIKCPQCQAEVSIDEAIKHQLEVEIKKTHDDDLLVEKNKLRQQMMEWQEQEKKKLEQTKNVEVEQLQKQLEEKDQKMIQEKLLIEQRLKDELSAESKLLKQELAERDKKLTEARDFELKLRHEKLQLEKQQAEFELDKQRQIDSERERIKLDTAKVISEEYHFKISEKEKQIDGMRKTIEELQMKATITSQQLQGEVLELELEQALKEAFPVDLIEPIGKGVRGADVVQIVRDRTGKSCGKIVWESKRTKEWEDKWLGILKENTLLVKGDASVIVSRVLPKDLTASFAFRDGVYVTNFDCFKELASILREAIIRINFARSASTGQNQKMEMVYNYITSSQFTQKVASMIEAYSSMKMTLDKEKLAMQKLWAQREKEIEKLQLSTSSIYGELQGLAGSEISTPEVLEFPIIDNFDDAVN